MAEQDKLRALRAEPSAEAKAVNTKQKIIKLTKDRLKVAKGYIVLAPLLFIFRTLIGFSLIGTHAQCHKGSI